MRLPCYDALVALGKRQKIAEERQKDKRQQQRSKQQKQRQKDKQNSKVVELRKRRKGKSASTSDELELLPERINRDQIPPATSPSIPAEPSPPSKPKSEERHKVIIQKNPKLKRIW